MNILKRVNNLWILSGMPITTSTRLVTRRLSSKQATVVEDAPEIFKDEHDATN